MKTKWVISRSRRKLAFLNQLSHGPGRPQAPPPQHPPMGLATAGAVDFADAVNTENRCASCLLWQEGHSGSALPITSFSKLELHSLQTYSKMGIEAVVGYTL